MKTTPSQTYNFRFTTSHDTTFSFNVIAKSEEEARMMIHADLSEFLKDLDYKPENK